MGYYALALMKHLKIHFETSLLGPKINQLLANERGLLQNKEFAPVLKSLLSVESIATCARDFLVQHNRTHALHVVSTTFFPQACDAQGFFF